jgi:hypothetical protein
MPLQRQGADHIVRLHPFHAQDVDAQRMNDGAHRLDLCAQLVGHGHAIGLVGGVQRVAEGLAWRVDHKGDVLGSLLERGAQHVDHPEQRTGGLAGSIGQRRQGMEGAVQVAGTIDQHESCHETILRRRSWPAALTHEGPWRRIIGVHPSSERPP